MLVEGVTGIPSSGLELGRCKIRRFRGSELEKRLKEEESYSKFSMERASAYAELEARGHSARADQNAKHEARLALDVLRLFVGSYYFDIHRRPRVPLKMGLLGTVYTGQQSHVLRSRGKGPIGSKFLGFSGEILHSEDFELLSGAIEMMDHFDVAHLNKLLGRAESAKDAIGKRLTRAASWFGKGTTADSKSDSFLMHAIAIEALLSAEGRMKTETLAERMAVLASRKDEDGICPLCSSYVSREFHERLEGKSQEDIFCEAEKRVIELYPLRHSIAHGAALEQDIEVQDLLDFETLVRVSILSFVKGGWESLDEFKDWLKSELDEGSIVERFCRRLKFWVKRLRS